MLFLECRKFSIWSKQTFWSSSKIQTKQQQKKQKSDFSKSSQYLPIAHCFDSKLKFLFNNSFKRVKKVYENYKHLINEYFMLKTYCFEVHASAISGSFAEVLREREAEFFNIRFLASRRQNFKDIASGMHSIRISKMSPFSASDLKLAITSFGEGQFFFEFMSFNFSCTSRSSIYLSHPLSDYVFTIKFSIFHESMRSACESNHPEVCWQITVPKMLKCSNHFAKLIAKSLKNTCEQVESY